MSERRQSYLEAVASLESDLRNSDLTSLMEEIAGTKLTLARCFLVGGNFDSAARVLLEAGALVYHRNDTRGHALRNRFSPSGFSG